MCHVLRAELVADDSVGERVAATHVLAGQAGKRLLVPLGRPFHESALHGVDHPRRAASLAASMSMEPPGPETFIHGDLSAEVFPADGWPSQSNEMEATKRFASGVYPITS